MICSENTHLHELDEGEIVSLIIRILAVLSTIVRKNGCSDSKNAHLHVLEKGELISLVVRFLALHHSH